MGGPILFTQIFTFAISPKYGVHLPGAPYFMAAFFLLTSLLLALYVTRNHAVSTPAYAFSWGGFYLFSLFSLFGGAPLLFWVPVCRLQFSPPPLPIPRPPHPTLTPL